MKKIFDYETYRKSMSTSGRFYPALEDLDEGDWQRKCNGLTTDEMTKLRYLYDEAWLKEVYDDDDFEKMISKIEKGDE